MFDEYLFTLGDFGKFCLPQPYTSASFIFLVQWQIFQNFAYRGRIRKSSNLDRTIACFCKQTNAGGECYIEAVRLSVLKKHVIAKR